MTQNILIGFLIIAVSVIISCIAIDGNQKNIIEDKHFYYDNKMYIVSESPEYNEYKAKLNAYKEGL